ncbi:MAG TPA: TfuA-like protein, partial [Sinorhizobium sp.]|nr:TfuA-like protein [Sinorhizobium sp.]
MAGAVASAETASRPIVAFLGPTLSVGEARRLLDAVYLPPAAQGSIVLAVKEFQPKTILLIDGIFQSEPAVRHKEILWALSRGIHVVGAASMGALRAAELYRYGMIGIGLIYRWYRRFHFAPDDAVAVLHGPASVGWAALTCARIDLRRTLRAAERRALIASPLRQRLDAATAS